MLTPLSGSTQTRVLDCSKAEKNLRQLEEISTEQVRIEESPTYGAWYFD